jgi:hypothetical protein
MKMLEYFNKLEKEGYGKNPSIIVKTIIENIMIKSIKLNIKEIDYSKFLKKVAKRSDCEKVAKIILLIT